MSSEPLPPGQVELRDVVKAYDRSAGARWRDALPYAGFHRTWDHLALDGVDLTVLPGESVGVIGKNGAGKSTLLKVVAGVTAPTSGVVRRGGRVASMIELGLGFHPDLTGAENAQVALVLLGRDRQAFAGDLQEITEFSGLGDALNAPLRHYSDGMRARLAFAVATQVPTDLLVVDEVLAVGDRDFQHRCLDRVTSMVAAGTSLLFVSHEMMLVAAVCQRTVHLRDGRVVDDGPTSGVVERYLLDTVLGSVPVAGSPLRLESLKVSAELQPWGRIAIDAEVHVDEPLASPSIVVDLSLPTIAPGRVSASCRVAVPALAEPGAYRLRGTSSEIGSEGGTFRVSVGFVDESTGQLLAQDHGDFRIVSQVIGARPMLAVQPEFTLESAAAPDSAVLPTEPGHRSIAAPIAVLESVTKSYPAARRRAHLRSLVPGPAGRSHDLDLKALDGLSLSIGAGEAVGIIGPNGAGKSTVLRTLAGLLEPDSGAVTVSGRVVPMLDVAPAFNPELTGAENVFVLGQLVGLGRDAIHEALPSILAFAGVEEVADAPVKAYSTGMRARLGFATSVHAPGDLLLVDELLTVGDEQFRRRALDELRRRGGMGATIVYVSHELKMVERLCERVVRMDRGRVIDDGPATEVIERYGGATWAGGTMDAVSGIRLYPLQVQERWIPTGGRLEVSGHLVVEQPQPATRLELSYRSVPAARDRVLEPSELAEMTMFVRTVVPAGDSLTQRGWYRYTGTVDRNEFAGEIDAVITAVDESDGACLSEAWQQVTVGYPRPDGFPGVVLDVDWQVESIDDPRTAWEVQRP